MQVELNFKSILLIIAALWVGGVGLSSIGKYYGPEAKANAELMEASIENDVEAKKTADQNNAEINRQIKSLIVGFMRVLMIVVGLFIFVIGGAFCIEAWSVVRYNKARRKEKESFPVYEHIGPLIIFQGGWVFDIDSGRSMNVTKNNPGDRDPASAARNRYLAQIAGQLSNRPGVEDWIIPQVIGGGGEQPPYPIDLDKVPVGMDQEDNHNHTTGILTPDPDPYDNYNEQE